MSALPPASSFNAVSPDFESGFRAGLQQVQEHVEMLLRSNSVATRSVSAGFMSDEIIVRKLIRSRARRSQYFSGDLFSEPGWDILLDLYASHIAQRRVSVTSLCVASGVPTTTALRWIKGLESRGMIVRESDPLDGRRMYLSLSASAVEAMKSYLKSEADDLIGQ